MSNSKRPKAFFLNGGMGRIISAIPALEKYYESKEDPDFIIVIEGICNIMNGHPTLDNKTYDMYHKNLFHTKLINMDIVSPEPYRLNEYFNQKCDIAQAFDILINKKGVRKLPAPTLILSKEELLEGRKAVDEIKKKVKKNILNGIAYVQSTFNNTIISIADTNGNVISWASAGQKGFKGSRKSTPYAAQIAADSAASKALEYGMKTLSVEVKGPGSGRETALRALQARGFKILSIKDTTPMPHNGTRPPKKRRV